MGKVVKAVGGVLGLGGTPRSAARNIPEIDASKFNVLNRTKKLADITGQRELARQRSAQSLTNQNQLIGQLQQQAAGQGPSLAQAQLKAASDRSLAQQMAAAAAARGANPAAAQRQLMQNQAAAQRTLGAQAAQTGLQEQQAAQQQLGSLVQNEQARADQLALQYMQSGLDVDTAQQQAQIELERQRQNRALGIAGIKQQERASENALTGSIISGLSGAGATIATGGATGSDERMKKKVKDGSDDLMKFRLKSLREITHDTSETEREKPLSEGLKDRVSKWFGSDENMKKNISSANTNMKEFLGALKAHKYEYKDPNAPGAAPGTHYSVMAQELENAGPVGKSMVKEVNGTKMVDYGRGLGAMLAMQAALNERMEKLEKKKRG